MPQVPYECSKCGVLVKHNSYSPCREKKRMDQFSECWECAFYEVRCQEGEEIVIDHVVYGIGKEPGPNENKSFLGMAGRRFDIQFPDGEIITTHNLWHGGTIPERFRDRLPNTARFVQASRELAGEITCWNPTPENNLKHQTYDEYKKKKTAP